MTLYKTGIQNPENGTTYWHYEPLGYQAAAQAKALAKAKLKRKCSNWVAVMEPVPEDELLELENE